MLTINLAKNAGFCFGVKKAVKLALLESQKNEDVFMLGDIVHNEHVVNKIDTAGVKVQDKLNPDLKGTLLLRAHGTVPEVYDEAKQYGLNIVDATCPLVLEIHEITKKMDQEGYRIIVIGDYGHDEVVAIAAQVEKAIIISGPEDVDEKIPGRLKKAGIVVQSTQNIDNARAVVSKLIGKIGEIRFVDTICGPTKKYQQEIRTMPSENDLMLVVGSFTSANTCRLTEISKSMNTRTYQVESGDDVQKDWFEEDMKVGIHAGASTPEWIIQEVVDRVAEIGRDF